MKQAEPKTVIVGAGMAGLTAAAYLARESHQVLLLEKNDRVGGLVHTFNMDGFYFDSGPRAFVNSGMVKPILRDLGIEWDYFTNSISIGIEDHLFTVDSLDALEEYKRILNDLYPAAQEDIERILPVIRKLSEYTRVLYRFDNPNFVDFSGNLPYILWELTPWSIQLLRVLRKMKKYNLPMEDFLEQLTDNQSLIDILTQFFFRKTPTYFALGYFYVYLDYFYPKDGTGALPRLLKEHLLERAVDIKLKTRVTRVNPSKKIISDSEGNHYPYDYLIWAADLKTLYRSFDLTGVEPALSRKVESESRRILASKGAESSFIVFSAVDRPPSYFQKRGGEHLFFTPSREGLHASNREDRKNLLANFPGKSRSEVIDWLDDFCRLNTYEVSIPALRDPSLAPEGQTGIMISCLFDYDLMKEIKEAGWYLEVKEIIENRIIQLFSESIYQGFADDILYKFSSTPLTIQEVAGSSEGAITGWSFETEIPVKSQLTELPNAAQTSIPGVFQAGQWAYSPAGVPIAMLTGWHAAQKIIKQ